MGARAKAFFSVAAIALALLCFWLWRFMPTQGWAEIDFQANKWSLVAAGWSTLLHAWPILAAGVMLGLGLGIGLLGMLFRSLLDADQRSEIEHLERLVKESREREQQSLVLARKELEREFQNARSLYDRAVILQEESETQVGKAFQMQKAAKAAQEAALQDVEQAQFRVRNAIAAAERIKRKHLA